MSSYLFYNGKILTMDDENHIAESVVVKDDKIAFVGEHEVALTFISKDTEKIDLKGRTLIPGFNDSHMHLVAYGLTKFKADHRNARSIEDLKNDLKKFLKDEKTKIFDQWVQGHGWNHDKFKEKRLPRKEDIDEVISDRPVYMVRACYHICVVNSKALELAGITKDTKDPEGGKIDRDPETGEPTGILRENAIYMVNRLIPVTENIEDMKNLIEQSIKDANKVGLTSIQTDDFTYAKSYQQAIDAYEQLKAEGRLNARINMQMLLQTREKLNDFLMLGHKTGDGDKWVRFGPLKLLADGSLGSRTAAMHEPYSDDPSTSGLLIYSDEEIRYLLVTAHKNGLQLAVHAIGDRTMDQVLDAYKMISEKHPKKDPRFRIVHCQIGSSEIFEKFKELDVIADIQPIFMLSDIAIGENRVGPERIKTSYAWKTMWDKGIRLSGGSDAPVETFNPIMNLYIAVTRQEPDGYPEGGWYPRQRIDVYQGLKIFTRNPAYDTYEENEKGMIKAGMLADLVILSDDIMEVPHEEIKNVEIDMTMLDGNIVYSK
ncbi:amidohydrolase [Clostridiisalibacter paucivorans]|uniref:amidohydrolase n=1 Tax=Clostridiisalibacter paucivorans TaxID=408753 RepID=UPI00047E3B9A|nr:amidohydrolase [Clostridiisalibacter paucivorans]